MFTVVRCRKDGHQCRKQCLFVLLVHFTARRLNLMRAYDAEKIVVVEKLAHGSVRDVVRTTARSIVRIHLVRVAGLLVVIALRRIGPKNVAHGSFRGRLAVAIEIGQFADVTYLRRDAPVNAEQLTLNERGNRQAIERFHAFFVEELAELEKAFVFESSVRMDRRLNQWIELT